jgi:AraC-like DNA-binding protein
MPIATRPTLKPNLKPTAKAAPARVVGSYLQPLLEWVQERGVALPALAQAAGLAPNALSPLPETLAAGDYVNLLDCGARLTQDPCFGLHVGERVKLGTYSVHGLMLLGCTDLGQALQQTMRYESLAHDLGRSALRMDGLWAEYQWHSLFPHASHHLAESVFAGIRVFGNWLSGQPVLRAPVFFTHSAPVDCSEHARIFGGPVHFNSPLHCARFEAVSLTRTLANGSVPQVLHHHAEQLLQEKRQTVSGVGDGDSGDGGAAAGAGGGIVALVRQCLVNGLAQERFRLAVIAQELNMTARTLQRKLSLEGRTFQQVLDNTRFALAQDYLRMPHLSLTDIAFLLGFGDQSAFSHGFKEWAGVSPGGFRANLDAK